MTAYFVNLKTQDETLHNLQQQVEHLTMQEVWIRKSTALLERVSRLSESANAQINTTKRAATVEEIEVLLIASATYFCHCFQGENAISKSELNLSLELGKTFELIFSQKNNDFIGWNGKSTKLEVKYSFDQNDEQTLDFARSAQINYDEDLVGDSHISEYQELLHKTIEFLHIKRSKTLAAMRERFQVRETLKSTTLINNQGEIIPLQVMA